MEPTVRVAAVTDHNTVKGLDVVFDLAKDYPDILIVPGVEIATTEGDVVLLGAKELPPRPWTVENVVDFGKQTSCVSVAVHPFREFGLGGKARTSGVDAIEVLNGGSSIEANRLAHDLAREAGLPGVAGSDSHDPSQLFSAYTLVKAGMDVEEILKAIKAGLVSVSSSTKSVRF